MPARRRTDSTGARHAEQLSQKERMLEQGWCPRQISYLADMFDSDTFSFFSQLRRYRIGSHQDCRADSPCVAYNADMENYTTKHASDDCNCSMVLVPYDEVIEILRTGEVPLISISSQGDDLDLRVTTRPPSSQYVAISHVWADGLGNPTQNALPICQIRSVRANLNQLRHTGSQSSQDALDGPLLFWMDTLCIPVKPEHKGLRLLSVDMMASIYAAARYVLVLDSELMSQYATRDKAELLARILSSAWMCRSWTLQEGVLATNCAVQFKNESKVLGEIEISYESYVNAGLSTFLWDNFLRLHSTREPSPLMSNTIGQLWELLTGRTIGDEKTSTVSAGQFTRVWNALAGRSTTMAEDQYIILANVLDFPLLPLLKLSTPWQRMQLMILSLNRIPFSLFTRASAALVGSPESRLNAWIPDHVTSEVLTTRFTLAFRSGCLKLDNAKVSSDRKLSILVLDKTLPASSSYYLTVSSISEDCRFMVEANIAAALANDDVRYSSVALVLENSLQGSCSNIHGACFYVVEWKRRANGRKHTLRLAFSSAARISKVEAINSGEQEIVTPHYFAEALPGDSEVLIEYDRPRRFKQLKTRTGDMLPPSHFAASVAAVFVATLAALVGMEYGIFKHVVGSKHPAAAGIFALVIGGLFLGVFLAPFVVLIFGAICAGFWYLTYDAVFVPLYHRAYIRSFEEHVRQKTMSVKLQRQIETLGTQAALSGAWPRWARVVGEVFERRRKREPDPELPMDTRKIDGVEGTYEGA